MAKQLKDGEENKRQIFEQVAREQTGKRRKLERTRPNERVEFGVRGEKRIRRRLNNAKNSNNGIRSESKKLEAQRKFTP